ncbi:MAG: hypothetical protein MZV64_59365 [Ignavibacteriales bacterium]|nr:hypothetical protein [Ignavibacteriales bacterium]
MGQEEPVPAERSDPQRELRQPVPVQQRYARGRETQPDQRRVLLPRCALQPGRQIHSLRPPAV